MREINTPKDLMVAFLYDWSLPLFFLFICVGAIHGIIVNSKLIVDKNEEGTVMKGFENTGKTIFWYLIRYGVFLVFIFLIHLGLNNIRLK